MFLILPLPKRLKIFGSTSTVCCEEDDADVDAIAWRGEAMSGMERLQGKKRSQSR